MTSLTVDKSDRVESRSVTFPPEGTAYNTPSSKPAHTIWRFIGWFAPDIVIEVHDESAPEWRAFAGCGETARFTLAGRIAWRHSFASHPLPVLIQFPRFDSLRQGKMAWRTRRELQPRSDHSAFSTSPPILHT